MGFKYFLPIKDELNGIFYGRNKNKITYYSTSSAPQIVTNGLQLNLDAGDSSSYPGSGTTWSDLSGNGNNATLINGPTYSSANGGSIVFDGTDDYAALGSGSLVNGLTDITLEVWFKADSTGTNRALIYGDTNDSLSYDNGCSLRYDSAGSWGGGTNVIKTGFGQNGAANISSSANAIESSSNIQTTGWTCITVTADVGSSISLYKNGQLDTPTYSISNKETSISNCTNFVIGKDGGGSSGGSYWGGSISIVRVYNRVLSASEVQQNYNALKDRFAATVVTSGLQLYLDAGDSSSYPGSGTTWYDLSGNNNNGTLVNGPTYSSDNGGCIVLDGSNDYVQFSTISAQTICFFGKLDTDAPNFAALVATTATTDGALRSYPVGNLWYTPNSDDFHYQNASSVMINGSSNLSQNTQTSPTSFTIPNNRDLFDDFYVGAIGPSKNVSTISHNFLGRAFKGRVYVVLIYNRQLSNSELLENFNAFKSRYGL